MIISEIELFELLAQQLGNEKAKTLVQYVETKVDRRLEEKTNIFATKEDILKLQIEIEKRFNQLTIWIVATAIAIIGLVLAGIKLF